MTSEEARLSMLVILLSMKDAGIISDFEKITITKNQLKSIAKDSLQTPVKIIKGIALTTYINLKENVFYPVLRAKGEITVFKAYGKEEV